MLAQRRFPVVSTSTAYPEYFAGCNFAGDVIEDSLLPGVGREALHRVFDGFRYEAGGEPRAGEAGIRLAAVFDHCICLLRRLHLVRFTFLGQSCEGVDHL